MKKVVFGVISLSLLLAVVGVHCSASEVNSSDATVDVNVLREEGRLFLKEMSAAGMDLDKNGHMLHYDMTAACHKYRWVGLTLGQAKIRLRAAGSTGEYYSVQNKQLPPNSGDENDLGAAFSLNYGEHRGPLFQISFRPENSGTGLQRKIKEVLRCSISRSNWL